MAKPHVALLGKAVKSIMKLRGGGSALPGLVVEKIDPRFIERTLAQLPRGVVVISGTNGKTTTTKMVVELLQSQGLKVFTNRTGSNFTRGVAAALLGEVDMHGKLSADIAVLELDEAHAVHFVRAVPPTYSLLLNVMRDQLDRFGEIDATAKLLKVTADATTKTVVFNREDPRLLSVAMSLPAEKYVFYGLNSSLESAFPSDDELHADAGKSQKTPAKKPEALVTLEALNGQTAAIQLAGKTDNVTLTLDGIYNVYNATAAIALVATIVGKELKREQLFKSLATIRPAFGRGEILEVGGQPCEIVLVKNPGGFRLGLQSFAPNGYATMIAINDNYADGRDMSWLWDVNFDSLKPGGVSAVSGIRAYDMALRLQYEEVEIAHIDTDLKKSLQQFIADHPGTPKRIYCTYTAMLALRRELAKITTVETIS